MSKTDNTEYPKFNLESVDIEALEAFRHQVFRDLVECANVEERELLRGIWGFYNCAINGYYLGAQFNLGIPINKCKVENK